MNLFNFRKLGKVVLFGLIGLLLTACQSEPTFVEQIRLTDLNGQSVALKDYKGKRIFLNLWATWCRPCVAEMPSIDKAYQVLAKENYVFLAVSDENPELIHQFKDYFKYSFDMLQIPKGYPPFQVQAIPATYVFDTKGDMAMQKIGAFDWASPEMLALLRQVK